MKCCNKIEKIGCFSACGKIPTGIKILEAGKYIIELDYMGISKIISNDFKENEEIIIDQKLNEDYTYIFRIYNDKKELLNNTGYSFKTYKICF